MSSAESCPTTASIMKDKLLRRILITVSVVAFWLIAWQLLSLIVNDNYFLPSPYATLLALGDIIRQGDFVRVIFLTILRVLGALLLGVLVGGGLAVLSHRFSIIRAAVSPMISIMKAIPVATFIILLWVTLTGTALTVFVGFMMVMPIIYQNVLDGFDSIPGELSEVCDVFELSHIRRFRILTLPVLYRYFAPALITSVGLSFKSQIAVEIIIYAKNTIGKYIFDAKDNLNTPKVFAWATVIIVLSLMLEFVTKRLLGRFKK